MPEISSFYGIVIYMYMSEHNPPHFHVKYQDYEAIITIKDGVITGSLPRRAFCNKKGGKYESYFESNECRLCP